MRYKIILIITVTLECKSRLNVGTDRRTVSADLNVCLYIWAQQVREFADNPIQTL